MKATGSSKWLLLVLRLLTVALTVAVYVTKDASDFIACCHIPFRHNGTQQQRHGAELSRRRNSECWNDRAQMSSCPNVPLWRSSIGNAVALLLFPFHQPTFPKSIQVRASPQGWRTVTATATAGIYRQSSEKPGFFKKAQPSGIFWVLSGFGLYWVFGIFYLNEQLGTLLAESSVL